MKKNFRRAKSVKECNSKFETIVADYAAITK